MPATHIEVSYAKDGSRVFGLQDGQLLQVERETDCFFYVKSFSGQTIKVSKKTRRACNWKGAATSPVFNI